MENNLLPSMKDTLFGESVDLGIEYSEIALDALTESEILKDLPIFSTIRSLTKTAISIRDRHLMKKLLVFVKQFNQGLLSEEEIRTYRAELEVDDKKMQRDMEYLLIILDRYIETKKSEMFANIYMAYINKDISWEQLTAFADILEKLLIYDFDELENIYKEYSYGENEYHDCAQLSRLSSLGLVQYFNGVPQTISKNGISGKEKVIRARISSEGKVFYSVVKNGKII